MLLFMKSITSMSVFKRRKNYKPAINMAIIVSGSVFPLRNHVTGSDDVFHVGKI